MQEAELNIFTFVAEICSWTIATSSFNPSNMKQVLYFWEDTDENSGNVFFNIFQIDVYKITSGLGKMSWEWLFIVPHKRRTRRHTMKFLASR